MSDEAEIARLLYRYARAVDTKDWELYRSVFTDDAHIDYSSAGAVVGPRDEVVDWFAANFGVIPWSMHYITNIESDISGDTATVRAMFYNPMQLPGMAEMSYLRRLLPPRTGAYARRMAQPSTSRGERLVRQPAGPTRFMKSTFCRRSSSKCLQNVHFVRQPANSAFGGQLTAGGGDFTAAGVAHGT